MIGMIPGWNLITEEQRRAVKATVYAMAMSHKTDNPADVLADICRSMAENGGPPLADDFEEQVAAIREELEQPGEPLKVHYIDPPEATSDIYETRNGQRWGRIAGQGDGVQVPREVGKHPTLAAPYGSTRAFMIFRGATLPEAITRLFVRGGMRVLGVMRVEEGTMTVSYRTHDDRLLSIVWKQTDVIEQGPAPPIDPDLEKKGEEAMRASGFFGDPLGEAYVKAEKSRCQAQQFSDMMVCSPCNLRWDTNDPSAPACRLPTAEKPLFVRCGCCGGSGRRRGLFLAMTCPECKGEGGKTFT